jgi:hypothetical protein
MSTSSSSSASPQSFPTAVQPQLTFTCTTCAHTMEGEETRRRVDELVRAGYLLHNALNMVCVSGAACCRAQIMSHYRAVSS